MPSVPAAVATFLLCGGAAADGRKRSLFGSSLCSSLCTNVDASTCSDCQLTYSLSTRCCVDVAALAATAAAVPLRRQLPQRHRPRPRQARLRRSHQPASAILDSPGAAPPRYVCTTLQPGTGLCGCSYTTCGPLPDPPPSPAMSTDVSGLQPRWHRLGRVLFGLEQVRLGL